MIKVGNNLKQLVKFAQDDPFPSSYLPYTYFLERRVPLHDAADVNSDFNSFVFEPTMRAGIEEPTTAQSVNGNEEFNLKEYFNPERIGIISLLGVGGAYKYVDYLASKHNLPNPTRTHIPNVARYISGFSAYGYPSWDPSNPDRVINKPFSRTPFGRSFNEMMADLKPVDTAKNINTVATPKPQIDVPTTGRNPAVPRTPTVSRSKFPKIRLR